MHTQQASDTLGERPFFTLFVMSGAVAIVSALIDVLRLAAYFGLGRLREIHSLAVLWKDFGEAHIDLLVYLPTLVNVPFDLTGAGSFFRFLTFAMLTSVVVTWSVACLLVPAVALLRLALPCADGRPVSCWWWRKAYPLAVAAGAYFPECIGAARLVASSAAAKAGLGLFLTLAVWWLLRGALPEPRHVKKFLRVAGGGSAAILVLAALLTIGLHIGESGRERQAQPAAAPGRPNILLVSIDSLRSDHLHCYGYPRATSPTIDRLAAEGVRFETAVAPTSWTLPPHLTLLTSLPPPTHGVVKDGLRLEDETLTLAEVLWQAGYITAGFVSGPYLDASYGFSQGFDLYDDYTIAKGSLLLSQAGVTSPKLLQVVSEWLRRWSFEGRKRPFFLFVHMWDVHYDYAPPPPYDTLFDPGYQGEVTGENIEQNPRIHKDMDPRDIEHLIALYDGEIRFTDEYLGRLVDLLISLDVLDETIFVVTADHGEEFFEHGEKGHRKALYDESILVPLILRFPPRVPAGRVVPQQVQLMDIAPTVLSLAGITPPAEFGLGSEMPTYAGRDLTALTIDGGWEWPDSGSAFLDLHLGAEGELYALRTPRHKLIQLLPNDSYQLFDLRADPGEQMNLLDWTSDTAKDLSSRLTVWKEHWRQSRHRSRRVRLTRDQEETLRSLGYIK